MADDILKYNELTPEVQGLDRQRKMAQLLMTQGLQQPQGQMISGHYVAPSFTQQLVPIANAMAGLYGEKQADVRQKELAQALRGRQEQAIQGYFDAMRSTPDMQVAQAGPPTDEMIKQKQFALPQRTIAGQQPDFAKAFRSATGDFAPSWLTSMAVKSLEPIKTAEGETIQQRNFRTGQLETIAGGGVKLPTDFKEAAIALNLPLDPSKWTPEQRGAVAQYGMQSKRAGATQVSVPVYTQKAYGQEFGGLVAKDDMSKYQAAQSAPKQIQQATQIESLLKSGAITGTGADFQLQLAKGLNLGGAGNQDMIKRTELLASRLGQQVLDNVRASGLGAGQGFTDKDRQFLEKVVGGTITLDKSTLSELARIQKQTANASMNAWNTRYKQMPQEVVKPMGLQPIYTPMGSAGAGNLFNEADAIISGQQR